MKHKKIMKDLKNKVKDILNTKDIENIETILAFDGLGTKIMNLLRAVEASDAADAELDKAEAQLLGFYHAKQGYDVISLIESMGLSSNEWEAIKTKYDPVYINTENRDEIDAYFAKNNERNND